MEILLGVQRRGWLNELAVPGVDVANRFFCGQAARVFQVRNFGPVEVGWQFLVVVLLVLVSALFSSSLLIGG